jgi:hypothetical protein
MPALRARIGTPVVNLSGHGRIGRSARQNHHGMNRERQNECIAPAERALMAHRGVRRRA